MMPTITPQESEKLSHLLRLSHELGEEPRGLAILGEGNTSARIDSETFLVKASGSNLCTLLPEQLVECRFDRLLPLLEQNSLTDLEVDQALFDSRVHSESKKPSVEALFHAYLLSLPGIEYVGHTHPIHANQVLCSPHSREFAERRLFPDDIVCCGIASVYVPYTDPGLRLAQVIKTEVERFIMSYERPPRVILLENHGVITLGNSPNAVLAAMLMTQKSAQIFIGSAALGGPRFLEPEVVVRIAGRPDEHYRQKALNL